MNQKHLHERIQDVQNRIVQRSLKSRAAYLEDLERMAMSQDNDRRTISCSNLAHVAAGAGQDKNNILGLGGQHVLNMGIITAYNDMLSAHKPYESYPSLIRSLARSEGATAQVAGGVPAMCDGVTQGRAGMELSLLSRDVIALATAVGLSHNVYDAVILLGICDKIVPGLMIGALQFGHLPTIFIPAGPMSTGIGNQEKADVRRQFVEGKVGRAELMQSEASAYHDIGTCTFYGTANSNQIVMELMGMQLPGSSFVHPIEDLRHALTADAVKKILHCARLNTEKNGIGYAVTEKNIVNAIVALHATGGSTNHTLHIPAMAAAAGWHVTWDDFEDLSDITPQLAAIYPNGTCDINDFHEAGGVNFVARELYREGLLDGHAATAWGSTLLEELKTPTLQSHSLQWKEVDEASSNLSVLRPAKEPFASIGGLKIIRGNLGSAVTKISAVPLEDRTIDAPARVFDNGNEFKDAFEKGILSGDLVIVLRQQGPKANGMPELHGLMPMLSALRKRGQKVALVTDGRLSGASGSILSVIHVQPEALADGVIGRICDGDRITIDAEKGRFDVSPLRGMEGHSKNPFVDERTFGRALFQRLKAQSFDAERGGGFL